MPLLNNRANNPSHIFPLDPPPGLPGYRTGRGLAGSPDARFIFFPTLICSPRVAATALAPCMWACAVDAAVGSVSVTGYDTLICGGGLGGEPEPVCSEVACLLLDSS